MKMLFDYKSYRSLSLMGM